MKEGKKEGKKTIFEDKGGFILILQEDCFPKGEVIMWDSRDRAIITKVYNRTRWRRFWTWVGLDMGLTTEGIKYKLKLIK